MRCVTCCWRWVQRRPNWSGELVQSTMQCLWHAFQGDTAQHGSMAGSRAACCSRVKVKDVVAGRCTRMGTRLVSDAAMMCNKSSTQVCVAWVDCPGAWHATCCTGVTASAAPKGTRHISLSGICAGYGISLWHTVNKHAAVRSLCDHGWRSCLHSISSIPCGSRVAKKRSHAQAHQPTYILLQLHMPGRAARHAPTGPALGTLLQTPSLGLCHVHWQ
jgi:hypothetical protein